MKPFPFLLIAGLVHTAAFAGTRDSASYSVPADSTEPGGGRATSVSYTVDTSIGGIAGISTVAAAPESLKAGFAGQLYDVTGLAVTSAAPSVNENASLQLAAWQVLDDSSFLALGANAVTWSVLGGPIGGISSAGLATAGTVFADTAASVQGAFAGFTGSLNLTVLNVNSDDFGTYAADGLPDDWQVQHFGADNPLAAPDADASHTGQTNLLKYVAGLNPTDHGSRFIVDSQAVAGHPGYRDVVISPRYPDRTYVVESTADFASWDVVTGMIFDMGTTRIVTDTNAGDQRYYHVRIIKQP